MSTEQKPRALVLRAPGINCERETAHACRLVGFDTYLVHINELLKAPATLLNYHFLVIPGGFSYGDDLGAGTLLAKNLTIHLRAQVHQFIAEGRLVLGICNGFQVLVRAGLLPGNEEDELRATLTENVSGVYECRWVRLATLPGPCIFTQGIDRPLEIPVAHGEGQFVLSADVSSLQAKGQIPLVYRASNGEMADAEGTLAYPDNPNGSSGNVAAVCNTRGTVFGMMPHPERFVNALQHPLRQSHGDGEGDGLLIFKNAYAYAAQICNDGSATGVASQQSSQAAKKSSYAASGVDIAAGEKAVGLMKEAVRATQGPEVLAGIGAFAGVFSASSLQKMLRPALVSSTDGVGTKTLIAAQAGRYDTIGYDIVNHSVNDLLMQGARPLFFMDYLAMGKLDPARAATIVGGIAAACREVGCALLGGETAEMPDVYLPGAFDLAGTIVGVVEEGEIINGSSISVGDVVLGLPSNGLHTNGYSLARRVFAPYALDTIFPELDEPLLDALLRPHRCYLREITQLRTYLADRVRYIKGMAHITGGGFAGNISRILPAGTQAVIDTNAWSVPPLFSLIARLGDISRDELYRAFNMGIGMVIVLSPKGALEARCVLPELVTIGSITEGNGVILR